MQGNLSDLAKWIIYKLVRKGRWGHFVIRESNIPMKNMPKTAIKNALRELQLADFINRKHGLGEDTYSLNSHKKKEVMEIYESFSRL